MSYKIEYLKMLVVLFAYPIKSNILTKKEVTQILQKKLFNHSN